MAREGCRGIVTPKDISDQEIEGFEVRRCSRVLFVEFGVDLGMARDAAGGPTEHIGRE